jgi:hypothetical protein
MTAPRCSFCGKTDAWPFNRKSIVWIMRDGRAACEPAHAEQDRLRQAVEPAPDEIDVKEVDGMWWVTQSTWAAEYRRAEQTGEHVGTIHIHAQAHSHDEAWIVGDADGLRALRDAIDGALAG